jgi:hypothetical protein
MFTQTTLCTSPRYVYYTTGKFSSHTGALVMSQLFLLNTSHGLISFLNKQDLFTNEVTFHIHGAGDWNMFVESNVLNRG